MFKKLGYIVGFIKGRTSGKRSAKLFSDLLDQYGAFESIPTRELQKMGDLVDETIRRQRLKQAAAILQYYAKTYLNTTTPVTIDDVVAYLDFEEAPPRMDTVSRSMSVVHALAAYARDVDGLDVDKLIDTMVQKKKSHDWFIFADNARLYVD